MTIYWVTLVALALALVWLRFRGRRRSDHAKGSAAQGPADWVTNKWVDTMRRDTAMSSFMATQTEPVSLPGSALYPDRSQPVAQLPEAAALGASRAPVLLQAAARIDKSQAEAEVSRLHREATAYKGQDWTRAILALQAAATLDREHQCWSDATRMVRLPVFLQQAGHYEAAMVEFERLLQRVPGYADAQLELKPRLDRQLCLHRQYEIIYDKMRLACKRQQLPDLAAQYAADAQQHRQASGLGVGEEAPPKSKVKATTKSTGKPRGKGRNYRKMRRNG